MALIGIGAKLNCGITAEKKTLFTARFEISSVQVEKVICTVNSNVLF